MQIQLTGFLDKDTARFCKELWLLCLSAQENPQGVPKELLEAKKLELIQEKVLDLVCCQSVYLRGYRLRRTKRPRNRASKRKKTRLENGKLKRSGGGNALIVAEEVVEEVVEVEISIDAPLGIRDHPQDGGAHPAIESLQGENQTCMFRQQGVAAAGGPDRQAALLLPHDPDLCRRPDHLPGDDAMMTAIDETAVAIQPVALFLRRDLIARGRGDTVQTTVTEIDPLPAVIHHAHVLPEETEGDKDSIRPRHLRAEIGARDDTPLYRGHGLSPLLVPAVE